MKVRQTREMGGGWFIELLLSRYLMFQTPLWQLFCLNISTYFMYLGVIGQDEFLSSTPAAGKFVFCSRAPGSADKLLSK